MNERTLHPLEYLVILKRRKWWFIAPLAVCLAIGVALALLLPSTFKSAATIGVQAATVTPDLVAWRGLLNREERLRALSQQLRSPAVLERVAREEGLTEERPLEAVMQELVGRINVELPPPIPRTDPNPELNAFNIVYTDRTAERAQRVTNRLAHVFVDEHSKSREHRAEGTAEFLGAQLRASQERIATLEARLRAAKEANMGKLPEQTLANLQTLGGMRQQLETTSNTLRSEQDRLSLLERQLQSMKQGLYSGPPGPGTTAVSPQQRVVALQRDLAAARAKYTDKHPEVTYLEEELKAARAEAAAAREQPEGARQEMLAGDPAYQNLIQERNLTQLRIAGLRRAEAQLRGDIGRYQQRIEAAPMVEQELASLQRQYEFEKDNYKQTSEKFAAAQMDEQIARVRGGERFSVINPAFLPDAPESPKRPRLLLMALAFGMALGAGLVFGREYLDWSIRDARALQDEFDVQVLAEIPRIHDAA